MRSIASPLQKAGEVLQVRLGLEIPQAEETVPPHWWHTSPLLRHFPMLSLTYSYFGQYPHSSLDNAVYIT